MRICANTLPRMAEYARSGRVVVFDTETTGGADYDEICQIAAAEYVCGNLSRTLALYKSRGRPVAGADDGGAYLASGIFVGSGRSYAADEQLPGDALILAITHVIRDWPPSVAWPFAAVAVKTIGGGGVVVFCTAHPVEVVKAFIVVQIHCVCFGYLIFDVYARSAPGLCTRLRQSRQQHRGKYCNYRYHNQQFNQCKTHFYFVHCNSLHNFLIMLSQEVISKLAQNAQ